MALTGLRPPAPWCGESANYTFWFTVFRKLKKMRGKNFNNSGERKERVQERKEKLEGKDAFVLTLRLKGCQDLD